MNQAKDEQVTVQEVRRFTSAEVAKVFGVPRELLIEPGHVMSREKYEQLLKQQK